MRRLALKLLVALAVAWINASSLQAQSIWNGGVERGFRPGTSIPFDGEPFSHKYGYGTGSFFYPLGTGTDMSGRHLNYLDYADKVERANKFGYPEPPDPFLQPPPRPSRIRYGLGFGYFRFR
jgi:hypothetical protein